MSAEVPVIHQTRKWSFQVRSRVDAYVLGKVSFTEDDVRAYYDLEPGEHIDAELLEEYACEALDEGAVELDEVTYWNDNKVTLLGVEKTMTVPPEFVPLPGMEGDL